MNIYPPYHSPGSGTRVEKSAVRAARGTKRIAECPLEHWSISALSVRRIAPQAISGLPGTGGFSSPRLGEQLDVPHWKAVMRTTSGELHMFSSTVRCTTDAAVQDTTEQDFISALSDAAARRQAHVNITVSGSYFHILIRT
jgi:hypothetical protein